MKELNQLLEDACSNWAAGEGPKLSVHHSIGMYGQSAWRRIEWKQIWNEMETGICLEQSNGLLSTLTKRFSLSNGPFTNNDFPLVSKKWTNGSL